MILVLDCKYVVGDGGGGAAGVETVGVELVVEEHFTTGTCTLSRSIGAVGSTG